MRMMFPVSCFLPLLLELTVASNASAQEYPASTPRAALGSLTKHLSVAVGDEQLSPLAFCKPTICDGQGNCDWNGPVKCLESEPSFTYPAAPNWQHYNYFVDAYVKVPGEDLLVPKENDPSTWEPAHWDVSPSTGFTDEKIRQFHDLYETRSFRFQYPAPNPSPLPVKGYARGAGYSLSSGRNQGVYVDPKIIDGTFDFPSTMPRPSDFAPEETPKYSANTYLVEFSVPASPAQEALKEPVRNYLMAPTSQGGLNLPEATVRSFNPHVLAPPADSYKLRGWLVKGAGIQQANGQVVSPLLIISMGHSIGSFRSTTGILFRRLAYYLSMKGYDVLLYDYQGRGVSTGWNQVHDYDPEELTGNAINIFHMVKQLAGGQVDNLGMRAFRADTLAPVTARLIESTASPVILWGHSHGAMLVERTMQLYVDDRDSNAYDGRFKDYNLRGVVGLGDLVNLNYYGEYNYSIPAQMMWVEAGIRLFGSTRYLTDSEVFQSIPRWPGYFAVKGLYNDFSPQGGIDAFNAARGFKDILVVRANHTSGINLAMLGDFTDKLVRFLKRVSFSTPDYDDTTTTTLTAEIDRSRWIDLEKVYRAGKGLSGGTLIGRPIPNAGPDRWVSVTELPARVTLDGSGSLSVSGTGITQYEWSLGGSPISVGPNPTAVVTLGAGMYTISLRVTDNIGHSYHSDSAVITVPARNFGISGKVMTLEGTPLGGATVSVPMLARSTRTDGAGAYRFADVPVGSYFVTGELLGYRSTGRHVTVNTDVTFDITLSALSASAGSGCQVGALTSRGVGGGSLLLLGIGLLSLGLFRRRRRS